MAGSSVSAAATAANTALIAPMPRLAKIESGTISMPTSASTTVMPLKNTALDAVADAAAMAAILSRPPRRSSR